MNVKWRIGEGEVYTFLWKYIHPPNAVAETYGVDEIRHALELRFPICILGRVSSKPARRGKRKDFDVQFGYCEFLRDRGNRMLGRVLPREYNEHRPALVTRSVRNSKPRRGGPI